MNTEPVMVAAADVIRTFGHGGTAVHALRGVSRHGELPSTFATSP
jgi:hypothetical protein